MTALLGIDIGTTATKAVVFDIETGIIGSKTRSCDLSSPHPGWAEEDPAQWWSNTVDMVQEVTATTSIDAVGVSGMVPCVVLVDHNGEVLRPSIQQNDSRAVAEIAELRDRFPDTEIISRTGSPITQQSVAPTLLWIQRNEPETWSKVRWIMGSYDFITYRLTGTPTIERNWALESGLYDLNTGGWAPDILEAANVDQRLLPPINDPSTVVGTVENEVARSTGLRPGTPVVAGAADHVSSAFAAGAIEEGDLVVKLGGAGDILLTTDHPVVDDRLYLDFHLVPGRFLPNGCMAASGSFIRWFQRELAGSVSLEQLDAEAAQSSPGASGVVALPYLLGEKTPINDPSARGAFIGLHLGHRRGDLFRAVLESVAYGFRHHLEVFEELGFSPTRIRLTDGGSKSRVWTQIIADVLGQPVEPVEFTGGSAFGVAFAAGVGTGVIDDWTTIAGMLDVSNPIEPDPDPRYEEAYQVYRKLYPALKEVLT